MGHDNSTPSLWYLHYHVVLVVLNNTVWSRGYPAVFLFNCSAYDKNWKLSRHSFCFVNSMNFPLIMYSKFVWPNLIWPNKWSVWQENVLWLAIIISPATVDTLRHLRTTHCKYLCQNILKMLPTFQNIIKKHVKVHLKVSFTIAL